MATCECHELRRVRSYPPDPRHSDLQSVSTLTTLTEHDSAAEQPPRSLSFWETLGPLRALFYLVAFSSTFTVLNCLFIYFVLLREIVETPGPVMWDATKTNYIVTLLSQISAILTDATIKGVLTATRPMLAARKRGSSWASWVAMGASGWSTIFQVSAANLFLNPWCLLRLALPVLALGIGSVVKFNADFGYYFKASNATMPVYAGLTPVNSKALDFITPADLSMFLSMFTTGLLTNTMFASPFAIDGCDPPCRSVALPGSLSTARQVSAHLNSSLYSTPTFASSSTVRFDNATGMLIRYDPLSPQDLKFDLPTECIYTGQQMRNGLQLCFRQDNLSLLVAWSACPKPVLDAGLCNPGGPDLPPWRTEPLVSGTNMSLYQFRTTTSYDRSTQAILDIHLISDPKQIPIPVETYLSIFTRALIPLENVTLDDTYGIGALIHQLTWIYRTYNKTFPDDRKSPVAMLQNLLATPVQFAVTSEVYANYSAAERGLAPLKPFPLPEDMITFARGGEATTKLVILPWAGWLFIAVDLLVHVVALGWFLWAVRCLWMARKRDGVGLWETETGMAEGDGIRAAHRARVVWVEEGRLWRMMRRVMWWRKGMEKGEKLGEEGESLLEVVLREKGKEEKVSKEGVSPWWLARRNRNMRVREVLGW
ncbi:hypothetical protein QBC34DRAFT_296908 [Podospora aff. communis PSN243]|uniref:Uncharacterized protein n=1 Tax=Podospora aff. communis PSN243 TaxID=3040156 RepID=A0AAV9GSL6_9PEZI|nr:hypothetical protein QBC34DRAFT_296908 [Podospora aff. communis PSN243]